MSFETQLSDDDRADIGEQLISDLVFSKPLPWKIESDWTEEVRDANGNIVTKCRNRELAEKIIQFAEDYAASIIVADAEVAAYEASEPDTGPFAGMQEGLEIRLRLQRIVDGDDPDDLNKPENR